MAVIARTSGARSRLQRIKRQAELKTHEALLKATAASLDVARALAPGRLPASINARPINQYAIRVASTSKIAIFHENGTVPHLIVPKGRILRFEVNGSVRFAKRVHHPGNEAIHFMHRCAEVGRLMLRRLLHDILR